MEDAEYQKMHWAEDRMWWYHAAHRNLLTAVSAAGQRGATILDAGCGTGGLLSKLQASDVRADLFGLDLDARAVALARTKTAAQLTVASINNLPFTNDAFDVIVSADVLCHRKVDEQRALRGFRRCLRSGGVLVLNVPAFDWMKSAHDEAVHTARRYTRTSLTRLLHDAGFSSVRSYYWNSLLFPAMVLRRKVLSRSESRSDVIEYPWLLESAFRAIARVEYELQQLGVRLPFGGSVLALAAKP